MPGGAIDDSTLKSQLTFRRDLESRISITLLAVDAGHPVGEFATRSSVRPSRQWALSFLLAGISLPRRRFAPIPARMHRWARQLRFQGSISLYRGREKPELLCYHLF